MELDRREAKIEELVQINEHLENTKDHLLQQADQLEKGLTEREEVISVLQQVKKDADSAVKELQGENQRQKEEIE